MIYVYHLFIEYKCIFGLEMREQVKKTLKDAEDYVTKILDMRQDVS